MTNKQITILLCSLAFLFGFAEGLSAQTITAKTKSGYSSQVEFLDVVGDSLQFKNEEGKTLTLPLKDFEKSTLISIIIENEKKNGTYGLKFKDLKAPGMGFGEGEDDLSPEPLTDLEQAFAKSTELKIGPDEDSYELLRVFGVNGRKLVIKEEDAGGGRFGRPFGRPMASERPLSRFDEPSLILIATRFIKLAKENEKAAEMAAEMAKQTELEAEKREEDAAAAKKRQMEQAKKRSEEEKNFTPKKRFDHCVVTVQSKVVRIPGSDPVDYQAVKTRTLTNDDGTSEDLGSYSLKEPDPNPDWLDQHGSSGWELVQVSHEKNDAGLLTSTFYFKRER